MALERGLVRLAARDRHPGSAFRLRIRHRLDMPVTAVVKNQNLRHVLAPLNSHSEIFFAFRLRLAHCSVKPPVDLQVCALRESQGTIARSLEIWRLTCCSMASRSRINLVLVVRRE